jgi:hypothetical protein
VAVSAGILGRNICDLRFGLHCVSRLGLHGERGKVNAIFVGEKRSGKTTLAFHLALETSGGIIVFDPKKEFRDWPATVSSIPEMEKFLKDKHRVIVWRPPTFSTDEESGDERKPMQESFNQLAGWVLEKHDLAMAQGWDKTGYHFTLLIDEAYNLQSHAWINGRLLRILSQCRPEILNVYQTFQSVKNVNSDSRSRVSDWYLFTITLPTDLKRLEEFALPEVIEQVRTLPEHEYVHFLNEKGTIASEIVTDSEDWFEPLDYQGEEGGFMAKDETDERDEFPADGIHINSRRGLDEAQQKYNRRKADDPKNKYRQRSSDNQREKENKGERGGNKKVVNFG